MNMIQNFIDKLCSTDAEEALPEQLIIRTVSMFTTKDEEYLISIAQNDAYKPVLAKKNLQRALSKARPSSKVYNIIIDLIARLDQILNDEASNDMSNETKIAQANDLVDFESRQTIMIQLIRSFDEQLETIYSKYSELSTQIEDIKKQYEKAHSELKTSEEDLNKKIGEVDVKINNKISITEENFSTKISDAVSKVTNKIEQRTKRAEHNIQKSKDSVISLTVTVLGIFASLTLAFSGSLSALNNLFNTSNLNIFEAIFKFVLVGTFVANMMFFLLYCIAKLNNKSIAMHCGRNSNVNDVCKYCETYVNNSHKHTIECYSCPHKSSPCNECPDSVVQGDKFICKLKNKFTYIYNINIICLVLLIASFIGFACTNNLISNKIFNASPSPTTESTAITSISSPSQ